MFWRHPRPIGYVAGFVILVLLAACAGVVRLAFRLTKQADGCSDLQAVAYSYALDLDTSGRKLSESAWAAVNRSQVGTEGPRFLILFVFSESNCHSCIADDLCRLREVQFGSHGAVKLLAVGSGMKLAPLARFLRKACPDVGFVADGERKVLQFFGLTRTPVVLVIDADSRVVLRTFYPTRETVWYDRFVAWVARLAG